MLIDKDCA